MNIRESLEKIELQTLSSKACFSSKSLGRKSPSELCTIRTVFQHDRDRILHSKAFRRLKYKTQVFLSPEGDHYRTRLTHTLEVSQVARTISRALHLNEDLTEAISLGHDLGHTPFGHIGERVLNELLPGGFHHVRQSLRVVDVLEKDGKGLNLTYEVRDGILKHSKGEGGLLTPDKQSRAQTLKVKLSVWLISLLMSVMILMMPFVEMLSIRPIFPKRYQPLLVCVTLAGLIEWSVI